MVKQCIKAHLVITVKNLTGLIGSGKGKCREARNRDQAIQYITLVWMHSFSAMESAKLGLRIQYIAKS